MIADSAVKDKWDNDYGRSPRQWFSCSKRKRDSSRSEGGYDGLRRSEECKGWISTNGPHLSAALLSSARAITPGFNKLIGSTFGGHILEFPLPPGFAANTDHIIGLSTHPGNGL